MRRILGAWPRKTAFALLIAAWSGSAPSEVTLDGSLGGARGPLPGPDFEIGADVGRQAGSNLFHSFGAFNLNASESATFSGPNTINNVLGRVTGGSGSNIDGLLRSTIPDANLFLLNPHGIVFGPSAELDVQGSFHASTGDFIRLEDGRQFDAVPSARDALLTTAPPAAFGFLRRQGPAPIEVNGSFLDAEGKTLSVIGGDIDLTGGAQLQAQGGRVNVASVASAGEVTLGSDTLGTDSFSRLGRIDLTQDSTIDVSEAEGRATGGGRVLIRGGQLVMDHSQVLANTKNRGGKGIDIKLIDGLEMKKESSIEARTSGPGTGGSVSVKAGRLQLTEGSRIRTNTAGAGNGGPLQVKAQDILLDGVAVDETTEEYKHSSGLFARNDEASGDAGQITVYAGHLRLTRGGRISAATDGSGRAGDVYLHITEELAVEGGFNRPEFSRVSVSTDGAGHGGNLTITIKAGRLRVTDGAQIHALTEGRGEGGNVTVEAKEIVLEGAIRRGNQVPNRSEILAEAQGRGNGGNITITAGHLHLKDAARIATRTLGRGNSGDVTVQAEEIVLEKGIKVPDGEVFNSILSVRAGEGSGGDAGDVTVRAVAGRQLRLRLTDGGEISALTDGSGEGGNVTIEAEEIVLEGKLPSILSVGTEQQENAGNAGSITLTAGRLLLKEGALIRAETLGPGKGGRLTITVMGSLEVRDGSEINTSTQGDGDAGRIDVQADTIKLVNRGTISSESDFVDPDTGQLMVGKGDAGRVSVGAERLEISEGGSITTTTRGPGRGGAVDIEADEIVLEGRDSGLFARSEGKAPDSGAGGELTVNAGSLMVKEGATISASTSGPGSGGKLSITAADLELRDGASITSESRSDRSDAGRSGEIFIQAADSFRLFNDSQVSVETNRADAGNIDLDVGFLLHLRDSGITTSVAGGEGRGGNINIDPVFVVLDNSDIIANAFGGPGGNIRIVADHFFASPDSEVRASSALGIDGVVDIDSPDTDLNAGLVELPADFFDVATLLTQGGAPGAVVSRLVVRKYEVLPDSPAALRVPPPGGLLNANAQNRETLWPDFEHASDCDGDG